MEEQTKRFSELNAILTLLRTIANEGDADYEKEMKKFTPILRDTDYAKNIFTSKFKDTLIGRNYNEKTWAHENLIPYSIVSPFYKQVCDMIESNPNKTTAAWDIFTDFILGDHYFDDLSELTNFFETLKMHSVFLPVAYNPHSHSQQVALTININVFEVCMHKIVNVLSIINNIDKYRSIKETTKLFHELDYDIRHSNTSMVCSNRDPYIPIAGATYQGYKLSTLSYYEKKLEELDKKRDKLSRIFAIGTCLSIGILTAGIGLISLLFEPIIEGSFSNILYNKKDTALHKELKEKTETEVKEHFKKRNQELVSKNLIPNEASFASLQEKIPSIIYLLQRQLELHNEILEKDAQLIPEKYKRDLPALSTFAEYFQDGRVDTIKEAVNLYVNEQRQAEFQEKLLEQEKARTQAQEQIKVLTQEIAISEATKAKLISDIAHENEKYNEKMLDIQNKKVETLETIKNDIDKIKSELDN